jgi:dTDP-4-amino-4,6-dideoxygalactose transaminase
MAATATSILHWNAIPVFADIDRRTFNLDPDEVARKVNHKTRAIVAPDIFGQSADVEQLRVIADENNLALISDTAQAPGALHWGEFAGTLADIGGFSLNHHKHITCGEGGLIVTNNDTWAQRMALLRNHGEVLVGDGLKLNKRHGILGYNFRLGEIEAAIARAQLKKLAQLVYSRQRVARRLVESLVSIPDIELPYVASGNTHVYYVFGMTLKSYTRGLRNQVVNALRAEGVNGLLSGYQNIHSLPLFAEGLAFGASGFPYNLASKVEDSCPVAEELHKESFFGLNLCSNEYSDSDVDLVVEAFKKVFRNLDALV